MGQNAATLRCNNNCPINSEFVDEFYRRTGASPIFAVELLRFLQDRNILKENSWGIWEEAVSVSEWANVPLKLTRTEALIESRLNQLREDLLDVLKIASVEGYEFTAQVAVSITGFDERTILRMLSDELGRKHGFVQETNEEHIGNGMVSHFRFVNVRYQDYIYNGINAGEKRLLHEKVARSLENLYGDRSAQIAIRLAQHYGLGQIPIKAVDYLIETGSQQASNHQRELALENLEQALSLARKHDYIPGIVNALRFIAVKVKLQLQRPSDESYSEARDLLEECIKLAEKHEMLEAQSYALRNMGRVSRRLDGADKAMYFYMESLGIAKRLNTEQGKQLIRACLLNIGVLASDGDRFKDAEFYYQKSCSLAEEINDDVGQVNSLMNLSGCQRRMAKTKQEMFKIAEESLNRAEQINDNLSASDKSVGIKILRARIFIDQGNVGLAVGILRESIVTAQQEDFEKRIYEGLEAFAYLLAASQPQNSLLPETIGFVYDSLGNSGRRRINELKQQTMSCYAEGKFEEDEQRGSAAFKEARQQENTANADLVNKVLTALNTIATSDK